MDATKRSQRLRLFDAVRGFSVVSMVLFHLSYDLYFLWGLQLHYFEPPFRDIWRASISWSFLLIAGLMCNFSHNNLRRALKYGLVALLIYVVTTIAAVDTAISYGIIFCMAASTLIAWCLERLQISSRAHLLLGILLFSLFLLTLHLQEGFWGILGIEVRVPAALFSTPWLSWLGFPGPHFASGDYYPILPYTLLFLGAAHIGAFIRGHGGFPQWCKKCGCRPLEFIGRHALAVYIFHQPLLLLCCQLLIA